MANTLERDDTERLVGDNVRELRRQRGWSLSDLSARLAGIGHEMSVSALSKMEIGDRGIGVNDLIALAEVFDVSVVGLIEKASERRVAELVAQYRSMRDATAAARDAATAARNRHEELEAMFERFVGALDDETRVAVLKQVESTRKVVNLGKRSVTTKQKGGK